MILKLFQSSKMESIIPKNKKIKKWGKYSLLEEVTVEKVEDSSETMTRYLLFWHVTLECQWPMGTLGKLHNKYSIKDSVVGLIGL